MQIVCENELCENAFEPNMIGRPRRYCCDACEREQYNRDRKRGLEIVRAMRHEERQSA